MATKFPGSKLKSYSPKAIAQAPPEQRRHLLRRFWLPAVLMLALAAGGLTGIIAAYNSTIPAQRMKLRHLLLTAPVWLRESMLTTVKL